MTLADNLLASVVKTYENDICCGLSGEEGYANDRQIFADLIVFIVRFNMDIRYCSDEKCVCSPLYNLAHHVRNNKSLFERHLYRNAFDLLDGLSSNFFESTESA